MSGFLDRGAQNEARRVKSYIGVTKMKLGGQMNPAACYVLKCGNFLGSAVWRTHCHAWGTHEDSQKKQRTCRHR